jgi:hypothetical protein
MREMITVTNATAIATTADTVLVSWCSNAMTSPTPLGRRAVAEHPAVAQRLQHKQRNLHPS